MPFPTRLLVAAIVVAAAPAVTDARTIEPRKIGTPADLRPGEGALLLSIRHQTPVAQTMHVRFVSADDDSQELKFERKVGLGGRTRMLARQVNLYAVPAGRWRLASHLAGCDQTIKPGEECTMTIGSNSFLLPSATYPAAWFTIEVPAGGVTDAGELNLELPRDTVFGTTVARPEMEDRIRSLRFKARALPLADRTLLQPFTGLTTGRVVAAPEAASATTCERSAKEVKQPFNPFTC